jgi:ankyrin repeat protein
LISNRIKAAPTGVVVPDKKTSAHKPAFFVVLEGPRRTGENRELLEGFSSTSEEKGISSHVIDNSSSDISEEELFDEIAKTLQPNSHLWVSVHGGADRENNLHHMNLLDFNDWSNTAEFVQKLRNLEVKDADGNLQKFTGPVHIASCRGTPEGFNDPELGPVFFYSADNIHDGFSGSVILDKLLNHIGNCIGDSAAMEDYCAPGKIHELISSQGISTIYIPRNSTVPTTTHHTILVESGPPLADTISLTSETHEQNSVVMNAVVQAISSGDIKALRRLQNQPYVRKILSENASVQRTVLNQPYHKSAAFMFSNTTYPGVAPALFEWAMDNGVDFVKQVDSEGNTPLMKMCSLNWHESSADDSDEHEEIARSICKRQNISAYLEHRNHDGKSALDLACLSANYTMVNVLLERGAKSSRATLVEMCRNGVPPCDKGDEKEFTKNYIEIARLLCKKFSPKDIFDPGSNGESIWDIAIKNNNSHMVNAIKGRMNSSSRIFTEITGSGKTAREFTTNNEIRRNIFSEELWALDQMLDNGVNLSSRTPKDSPFIYICKGGLLCATDDSDLRSYFLTTAKKLLEETNPSQPELLEALTLSIEAGDYALTKMISSKIKGVDEHSNLFAKSPNLDIKILGLAIYFGRDVSFAKEMLYRDVFSDRNYFGITPAEKLQIYHRDVTASLRKATEPKLWTPSTLGTSVGQMKNILDLAEKAKLKSDDLSEADLKALELATVIRSDILKILAPPMHIGPLATAIGYYDNSTEKNPGLKHLSACASLLSLLPPGHVIQALTHPISISGRNGKTKTSPLLIAIVQGSTIPQFIEILKKVSLDKHGSAYMSDVKKYLLKNTFYKSDFKTEKERDTTLASLETFLNGCKTQNLLSSADAKSLYQQFKLNMSLERPTAE